VTRACETCRHAQPTNRLAVGPTSADAGVLLPNVSARLLACTESPQHIEVRADHFCGRWRLAEALAGGTDARTAEGART